MQFSHSCINISNYTRPMLTSSVRPHTFHTFLRNFTIAIKMKARRYFSFLTALTLHLSTSVQAQPSEESLSNVEVRQVGSVVPPPPPPVSIGARLVVSDDPARQPLKPVAPAPQPLKPVSSPQSVPQSIGSPLPTPASDQTFGTKIVICSPTSGGSQSLPSVTVTPTADPRTPSEKRHEPAKIPVDPRDIISPDPAVLKKRALLETVHFPGHSIDDLVRFEVNAAYEKNTLLENRETNGQGLFSSKRFIFGRGNTPVAAWDQEGCTTLWIIAKGGMYAAHFWETPSFGDPIRDGNGDAIGWRTPTAQRLQTEVIDKIRNGDGNGKCRYQC
jgi:hypothetical protein